MHHIRANACEGIYHASGRLDPCVLFSHPQPRTIPSYAELTWVVLQISLPLGLPTPDLSNRATAVTMNDMMAGVESQALFPVGES